MINLVKILHGEFCPFHFSHRGHSKRRLACFALVADNFLNYYYIIEGTSLIVVKFVNDRYCRIGLKLLNFVENEVSFYHFHIVIS